MSALSIAITADPHLPVPPTHYGGIERIIHFLVESLTARGHRVTLFAHPASQISGELVRYPAGNTTMLDAARNAATIAGRVLRGDVDIVHSFGRLGYLAPLAVSRVPKIMSYQRPITRRSIERAARLFGSSLSFTACSRHMIAPVQTLGTWDVVYNGVPLDAFTFSAHVDADAPLVFLGRLDPEKGAHTAIAVARRARRRLILAGNIATHPAYFEREIKPHVDDEWVRYIGPVDDVAKNQLLGGAAAFLMPIHWDEPFGIVMAEALACGTPVIGLRRGSVPEVVRHGVTGYVEDDEEGLAAAVDRLDRIDRRRCRTEAEARFSDTVIVDAYEAIYQRRCHGAIAAPAAHPA
jgi:glycosyltransferase involved in cell wall biosynthesis